MRRRDFPRRSCAWAAGMGASPTSEAGRPTMSTFLPCWSSWMPSRGELRGCSRVAERRMFAKAVIGSARFLRMPPTSRLLYYDLGMYADDDGIVEAFSIMRMTGATEDDLRVLVAKGFVLILNEDLVAFIVDWRKNNFVRSDRYHPSIYHDLLVQLQEGTQLNPTGIPVGNQRYTEGRLDQVNLGEREMERPTASRTPRPPLWMRWILSSLNGNRTEPARGNFTGISPPVAGLIREAVRWLTGKLGRLSGSKRIWKKPDRWRVRCGLSWGRMVCADEYEYSRR